mgnify:CR=1 FL=1
MFLASSATQILKKKLIGPSLSHVAALNVANSLSVIDSFPRSTSRGDSMMVPAVVRWIGFGISSCATRCLLRRLSDAAVVNSPRLSISSTSWGGPCLLNAAWFSPSRPPDDLRLPLVDFVGLSFLPGAKGLDGRFAFCFFRRFFFLRLAYCSLSGFSCVTSSGPSSGNGDGTCCSSLVPS